MPNLADSARVTLYPMSGNNITRIFLARLAGTAVFDPNGDPVGKVRCCRDPAFK
jgi:hypothetical protein